MLNKTGIAEKKQEIITKVFLKIIYNSFMRHYPSYGRLVQVRVLHRFKPLFAHDVPSYLVYVCLCVNAIIYFLFLLL